MKSFYEWATQKYLSSDTPRGDFARDASEDKEFPQKGDCDVILNYLYTRRACDECIKTFKRMWRSYVKDYVKVR